MGIPEGLRKYLFNPWWSAKQCFEKWFLWQDIVFRRRTPIVLVHASLKDSEMVGVDIVKTKKGTAYKVLPRGDKALLYLKGHYESRGRWAPRTWWPQPISEEYVVFLVESWSHGGGLASKAVLLAVPLAEIGKKKPLFKYETDVTDKETEVFVVLLDGTVLPLEAWEAISEEDGGEG